MLRHCPVCGRTGAEQQWSEEVFGASYTSETSFECQCGYEENYAYRNSEIIIGSLRFGWSFRDDPADAAIVVLEANRAILSAREEVVKNTPGMKARCPACGYLQSIGNHFRIAGHLTEVQELCSGSGKTIQREWIYTKGEMQ